MRARWTAIPLFGALACATPGSAPADSDTARPGAESVEGRDEILTEVNTMYADLSARDWDALATHFWPGATITTVFAPPGEEAPRVVVIPVPEFIAKGPEGPGSKEIFEERMTDARVLRYENVAVVWSSFAAKFGDPGEVMEWSGIDAITLMQHDGRWRIVSISFASDR